MGNAQRNSNEPWRWQSWCSFGCVLVLGVCLYMGLPRLRRLVWMSCKRRWVVVTIEVDEIQERPFEEWPPGGARSREDRSERSISTEGGPQSIARRVENPPEDLDAEGWTLTSPSGRRERRVRHRRVSGTST